MQGRQTLLDQPHERSAGTEAGLRREYVKFAADIQTGHAMGGPMDHVDAYPPGHRAGHLRSEVARMATRADPDRYRPVPQELSVLGQPYPHDLPADVGAHGPRYIDLP